MPTDAQALQSVSETLTLQRLGIGPRSSARDADPERRTRYHTLISVDDHLVEPPHLFEGRLPRKYADREPRVIENSRGRQAWLLDSIVLPDLAVNAVAGSPIEEQFVEPVRFDKIRRGTWDVATRIADMDTDG